MVYVVVLLLGALSKEHSGKGCTMAIAQSFPRPNLVCVYANQLRAPDSTLYCWKKDMFTGRVCKGSPIDKVNFRREVTM